MSEAMKVQIITAHKGAWYSDRIGDVFEVSDTAEGYGYIVKDDTDGKYYAVKMSDVEVLTDGDSDEGKPSNMVDHPPHYNYGDIEVIDYIEQVTDAYTGRQAYLSGNIIKYVSRAPHKNGAEDIRKAIWYAERLAEDMERS